MCCFIEGNQTLVHGRGGRGYGAANVGFSSGKQFRLCRSRSSLLVPICIVNRFFAGCHQWKFLIVKENRGNEGTCVGVAKWPIKDQSHRTSEDMWLYRAYRYAAKA